MIQDTENDEGSALKSEKQPRIVSGMNRPAKVKPLGEQGRAVLRQELMVILGNVGILSGGMSLGLPTIVMDQLKDPTESVHLSDSQATWFASINTLSCPLGGLLSGYLLDKFGRKRTLYVMNFIFLLSWILMATAASSSDITVALAQLLTSRFLMGVSMGLASAPCGVYSAEISLPKIRSRLLMGTSISTSLGILVIYSLGYFIRNNWQLLAIICGAYQLIAFFCILPMPETPSWLISKGRLAEAKRSLNYFRGLEKSALLTNPEVVEEFNLLQKNIQLGTGERKPPFLKCLRQPEVYKPLLILIGLFAFQQMTAVFVIVVYAVQIALEANVSIDPFLMAVLIGLTRVIMTVATGKILEKWGRRRSGLISALGMTICMFLLAAHGFFEQLQRIPYVPVFAILAFIILSTFGLYTLPFFMISELFPQRVRGTASGLTVAFGMFAAFCCIKTYPTLKDTIGNEYVFIIYGLLAFVAMVFIYLVLPETRGRTLLQIEEAFRSGKQKQDNKKQSQFTNKTPECEEVFIK